MQTPIRAARLDRGLSQNDAAKLVGIDQGAWSRVERGQQQPRVAIVFDIARLLDLTVEDVLSPFADKDQAA